MKSLPVELRQALRQLLSRPAIHGLAVVSLALGIGANTSMFTLIDAVLFDAPPVARPDELVELYTSEVDGSLYSSSSAPDYRDLAAKARSFTGVGLYSIMAGSFDDGERTRLLFGEVASGNFFEVLGIEPALGRFFRPEEDAVPGEGAVVVLGHGFWQREMAGDPGVLGRQLELSGRSLTVVGVAPESYRGSFPGLAAAYWVPLSMHDALSRRPKLAERQARSFLLKARLAPGVGLEQARAELASLGVGLAEQYPESNDGRKFSLMPASDVTFDPEIDGALFGVAGLLLAVVGIVLLIACSNIANLLLARAIDRRREIALRQALGAGRRHILRQLLLESLLLALAGGALGLLLAAGITRLVLAFQPPLPLPLALDLSLDGRVLLFTLAVSLATGLACGLAPAIRASRPQLLDGLRTDDAGFGRGLRKLGLRNTLVVSQVALSTLLLLGSGLFLRSLGRAQAVDPGFSLRHGVAASIAYGIGQSDSEASGRIFYRELLERMAALPGVEGVALARELPLGFGQEASGFEIDGEPLGDGERGHEIDSTVVSPGYFATLGIALPWGRDFTPADEAGTPRVAIVNEEAARRFWPGQSPLGKHLRFAAVDGEAAGPWMEVVGVAATGKVRTLGEKPRPFVYRPYTQDYVNLLTLVVASPGDERSLIAALRETVESLAPGVPFFDLRTVPEHLAITLFPARMGAGLLAAFGLLGLVLASVGLYGVVAYAVSRRTREMGLRLALGAGRGQVLGLVVREGMSLVLVGIGLGMVGALALGRLLAGWLFGISPGDPLTFTVVPLLLAAVAAAANLVPARRATRIDPSVALRGD